MTAQPRQLSFDDLPQPVPLLGGPLTYALERSPRRTRSVQISVQPDLSIRVVAPMRLAKSRIDALVKAREPWILNRREEVRAAQGARLGRRWVDGEHLPLLDGTLELRVRRLPDLRMLQARQVDEILDVTIPDDLNDPEAIPRIVQKWYRLQAQRIFIERTNLYAPQLQAQPRRVLVRNQESRWGSCAHDGTLRFCWRLVLAPLRILDYVVVHELSHIHHPHHQQSFWDCVATILPNHHELRAELRRSGETYRL